MTAAASEQAFYLRQSANTDPGPYAGLLDSAGNDVERVFAAARNVVEHHAGLNSERIGRERLAELDIYTVRELLAHVAGHGVGNLRAPIPLAHKVVGNCLNISKLACAMLRQRGVPARLRYAYCSYFYPDFAHEQTLVEYWDTGLGRWLRGDASMNRPVLEALGNPVQIDLRDVAPDLSLPIAQVWRDCRAGLADFAGFGASVENRKRAGAGNVALKMLQDLACLNHVEMMPWDFAAPSARFLRSRHLDLPAFDALAALMLEGDWHDLLYVNGRLPFFAIPRRVLRRSPYTGCSVTLVKDGIWITQ
ncbi:transglutaminase domain-containing protein [Pseudoduganella plicata]|uniref:Transglutaminase-like domain-containing protein n=1 Tax=Pseudoduganella plicata TaxID=321984 RepID=A0A4P7BLC2_9BURK|nr:transglutaminase domain-containing protein [Pseudoduganella plicata]QBQ38409.1 hypothetical protein E1742_21195 [Pseudoduganella plicata]GGY81863.1 hypothetical protein GCM10007388_13380 [Pseudoduganella plicata]